MVTILKRIVVWLFNLCGIGLYYLDHPNYKSAEWNEYYYTKINSKSHNRRLLFYREVAELIDQYKVDIKGKSVIDVGCGDGELLKLLKEKYEPSITLGIDSSYEAVKLSHANGIDAIQADLYKYKTTCDIVFCTEVLEHLNNPRKALQQIMSFNPQYIILTVPDGRKDTWCGHINFWSDVSWAVFLSEIFTNGVLNTGRLNNGNILFCCWRNE